MNKKYLLKSLILLGLSIFFMVSFSPRSVPLIITVLPTAGISYALFLFLKALQIALFRQEDNSWFSKFFPLIGAAIFGLSLVLASLGQLNGASFLLIVSLMLLSGFFLDRMKLT